MATLIKSRLFFALILISFIQAYNCASYKQLLKHGQLQATHKPEASKHIRVQLSKSEKLDKFEALSRFHDAFVSQNVKDRLLLSLNSQLIGTVGIGSPVQEFKFVFDTTYSNMWISSLNCTNCGDKKRYNSSASTTYVKDGSNIHIGLDEGFKSIDQVTVGDIVIKNQTFVEMITTEDFFEDLPADGLFCLGYNFAAKGDVVTPVREMMNQKLIDYEMFSIYQNATGGEILFGGYDESRFKGFVNWVPNYDLVGWAFMMDSITLKKSAISEEVKVCEHGCKVDINTYLPYIVGPPKDVMQINEALGAKHDEDDDRIFVLPDCDLYKLPNLVFTIHFEKHIFKPEQYILKMKKGNKTVCISSLIADSMPWKNEWFIGSSVIGHIYTVFDFNIRALGFGSPK